MQEAKRIAIVGSGLVGSLLALCLKHRGHHVEVYDRRPDIRKVEFSGRSINLAMSLRGWKALDVMGIREDIMKLGIPMNKRAIHNLTGELKFQPYGNDGGSIYSISRAVLNRKMIDLAEEAGVNFMFECKVWDVSLDDATIYTARTEKEEWEARQYDMVFGADGAFSRIRHKMQRTGMFNFSQEFLETGYKELTIPPKKDGSHHFESNSLHIWPRGNYMLIALPNPDGSFTCTLFLPVTGKLSFESLHTEEDVTAFFRENFQDLSEYIPFFVEDYFKNPTSYLVTTKCYPWVRNGKVVLVGDAAHAIVPFYGQGLNAGFEDITVLNDLMNIHVDDWETILDEYQRSRKPNTDAIAELSYRNFIEMSINTADDGFLLRKKIEAWFSEKYPDLWMPLYSMVTFSEMPYADALRIGDKQKAIMDEIMKLPDIDKNWNSSFVENKILDLLK